jgi:hypothetical protein
MDKSLEKIFRGGHLTQNSGGLGPDDYLFRRLPRKPWVKVVIRVGEGREAYLNDLDNLALLFKYRDKHLTPAQLQTIYRRTRNVPTMNATDFVNKYGGD